MLRNCILSAKPVFLLYILAVAVLVVYIVELERQIPSTNIPRISEQVKSRSYGKGRKFILML